MGRHRRGRRPEASRLLGRPAAAMAALQQRPASSAPMTLEGGRRAQRTATSVRLAAL